MATVPNVHRGELSSARVSAPPRTRESGRRLAKLTPLSIAVLATGVVVVLAALHPGEQASWTDLENIAEAVAAGLATLACVFRSRRERAAAVGAIGGADRSWLVWSLIAAGMCSWTLAQVGWSVIIVGFGSTPPELSLLDAGYLLAPALIVAGLLTMVQRPAARQSKLRAILQALLIAGGALLLSWGLIVGSVSASDSTPLLAQVVNLAYPLLDVVALSTALSVAFWRRDRRPAGLGLLALGIGCMAVSDSVFWSVSATTPNSAGASPVEAGYVVAFGLIAFAALRPLTPRTPK